MIIICISYLLIIIHCYHWLFLSVNWFSISRIWSYWQFSFYWMSFLSELHTQYIIDSFHTERNMIAVTVWFMSNFLRTKFVPPKRRTCQKYKQVGGHMQELNNNLFNRYCNLSPHHLILPHLFSMQPQSSSPHLIPDEILFQRLTPLGTLEARLRAPL